LYRKEVRGMTTVRRMDVKPEVEPEEIFVKYANASLRDNPEILNEILGDFEKLDPQMGEYVEDEKRTREALKNGIKYFVRFMKCSLETAKAILEELDSPEERQIVSGAFEYAYGYSTVGLSDVRTCYLGNSRSRMLENEGYSGPFVIKCCECHQFFFNSMLKEIIQDKEYWDVGDGFFELMVEEAQTTIRRKVVLRSNPPGDRFQLRLAEHLFFEKSFYSPTWLEQTIKAIAGNSLIEFLLRGERTKLRQCTKCEKFYISKSLRPSKFCSDPCRLSWHNQRRIASGKAKDYKAKKRKEGAKESYYG
jgi:hypothetical protein